MKKKQLSFRKTRTMGTLASEAEIGVWVKAPKALLQESGVSASEKIKLVADIIKILQSSAFLYENGSECCP